MNPGRAMRKVRASDAAALMLFFFNLPAFTAAPQLESFGSEASATSNGWTLFNGDIGWGWADTSHAGGTPGEAVAMSFTAGTQRWYADTDLGGTLDFTQSWQASGQMNFFVDSASDGGMFFGFFNRDTSLQGNTQTLAGFLLVNGELTLRFEHRPATTYLDSSDFGLWTNSPRSFLLTYVADGAAPGVGRLTATLTNLADNTTTSRTVDIDASLIVGATLNSFGFYAMDFASGRATPLGWAVDSLAYVSDDTTPPTAAPTVSPKSDAAGWNKANVTIYWHWADKAGSGIDPANCTKTTKVSTEGTQTRTATCKDLAGNQGSASWTVKIDKTPPTCAASAKPSTLTPANHRLVTIATTVRLSDALSGPDVFRLVSVASSQADSGLGAGDLPNDEPGWAISSADTSGQLRAEKFNGARTYTITYRATDKAGNQKLCSAPVTVP